ncbi:MAG TPA: neuraminidase-like domain-containing protein, partial [Terrimicrobiaceae bacterium]
RHLFNVNNPEGFDLSKVPHHAISDADFETARDRFTQLLNLTVYSDLKKDLGTETDDLVDVFEATQLEANRAAIARLTRREKVTVNLVIKALFGDNPPLITSQTKLSRLWQALHIVERIGVPVEALLEWTRIISPATLPAKRFAIAHDLKEALKAQLEPEAWLRVAQPIFDKLRQRQRDALVAFVKHQQGFVNIEQLYEYFLIDPGMEPVVQTSRIRLAISSLQLFIQRCLLNLEKKVHPSALNSKQWEWMKRYRVWEANRKIFLFPENWLEPEFRDDKTHLFAELESNLLQGDVSNDLVEDSFLNYLKRLEELARLEIVAMHLEDAADPANRRLHVFGRTFSLPYKYFYRRFAHQMWTPWEPVSAEIEGDHLAPVIWRDRLYLFWVTFFEQAEQPTPSAPSAISKVTAFSTSGVTQSNLLESGYLSAGNEKTEKKEKKINEMTATELTNAVISSAGTYAVEARLHWSEYLQGKWTMHESSGLDAPSPIVISGLTSFDRRKIFIHVSKEPFENGEERGVFIHLGLPINRAFYLAGRNSVPERGKFRPAPAMPYGASVVGAGRYFYKGALKVEYKRKITTEDGKDPVNAVETPGILQQGAAYTLLPCDNDMELGAPTSDALNTENPEAVSRAIERGLPEIASLTRPFFYQDNAHTFFVEPDVEERTVEQWEEWVTRSPQPEVEVVPPLLWPEFIKPHIPKYKVPTPIDPDDPIWRSPIHHDSILKAGARNDWLVNSATALLYQGELIGPVGKARVIVRAGVGAETFGAEESGEIALTIHAGSALTAGSILVAEESDALDQAGLAQAAVPLSIVGGSGFNSALAQSFVAGLNSPGVVARRIHR